MNLTLLIAVVVVADAIVLCLIARHFLKKNGASLTIGGMDIRKLAGYSRDMHEETGRYLEANYSGDPQQLPRVMRSLMELGRKRATETGLVIDSDVLAKLLEASVARHRVAKLHEIRSALDQAA